MFLSELSETFSWRGNSNICNSNLGILPNFGELQKLLVKLIFNIGFSPYLHSNSEIFSRMKIQVFLFPGFSGNYKELQNLYQRWFQVFLCPSLFSWLTKMFVKRRFKFFQVLVFLIPDFLELQWLLINWKYKVFSNIINFRWLPETSDFFKLKEISLKRKKIYSFFSMIW